MNIDRTKLYDSFLDFFEPSGNAIMKLTPMAAVDVCLEAAARKLLVLGVEGGIHNGSGFEARLDCIWDGLEAPLDQISAQENNLKAIRFIRINSENHNAFIITVTRITG